MQARETSATQRRGFIVAAILFLVVPLVLGLVIAQKNLRMGRGDRVGASRVAWFVFATFFVSGLFEANHTQELGSEFLLLLNLVAFRLLMGVQTWLSYVALEPYTRRRWPEMLISWNRLLAGKWQDPLVGRDILLGAAFAGILTLWWLLVASLERLLGMQGIGVFDFGSWTVWGTVRQIPTVVLGSLSVGALAGLAYLFALLLIRAVVRKQWLAILGLGLVQTMIFSSASPTTISWILGAGVAAVELYLLVRHGLLALAAFIFFAEAPASALTLELSAWYAPVGFVHAAILLAIAGFGFYTATRGRRLFGTSLLED